MEFKDLNDLAKYIPQLTKEAMLKGNATKNTVIETGKEHVQSDVYDPYTPVIYERSGGLMNDWEVEETADGIEVYNTRSDEKSGKNIVDTIEYGRNYDYEFEYSNKPRPFIENTIKELEVSNKLSQSLKADLKSIGIEVK
ncbi:hypothetical protein [Heyndrickxia camelliae]|uniref:HK97 gp10 family phage protein n=1 Tax=Heyndrickxia camelliae TaxID=1707093 RepID=A0A2N3LE12_9BACI|nr:hypothetical protein [Heyndrickxia camelliae]PKR82846.1 hypothetical protein CWO92_21895 [Heyndrickxia camelliae]